MTLPVAELAYFGKDKGLAIRAFMREAPFRGMFRSPVSTGCSAAAE